MPRSATLKRDPDSPGASYTREYRERIEQGIMLVKVPVYESDCEFFIADGLLDGWSRDDREAVADAVRAVLDRMKLEKAAENGVSPEDTGRDDPSL